MNKIFCRVLCLVSLSLALVITYPNNCMAVNSGLNAFFVAVDGTLLDFPDQQPYLDNSGRIMVPIRTPLEIMGATMEWDEAKKQVHIVQKAHDKLPNADIYLTIGKTDVMVGGQVQIMDTVAVITNQRTMVPLRFISTYLGAEVDWDSENRAAHIFTKNQSISEIHGTEQSIAKQVQATQDYVKYLNDPKIRAMYDWGKSKGYDVSCGQYVGGKDNLDVTNVQIQIGFTDPNKQQFDADVTAKINELFGKEMATSISKSLDKIDDYSTQGTAFSITPTRTKYGNYYCTISDGSYYDKSTVMIEINKY